MITYSKNRRIFEPLNIEVSSLWYDVLIEPDSDGHADTPRNSETPTASVLVIKPNSSRPPPSTSDPQYDKIVWSVAKRFLNVIYLEGPILRTNLAMKTGMNYAGCVRYVAWMLEIGWVEIRAKPSAVCLTERGIEVFNRLKY